MTPQCRRALQTLRGQTAFHDWPASRCQSAEIQGKSLTMTTALLQVKLQLQVQLSTLVRTSSVLLWRLVYQKTLEVPGHQKKMPP